MNLHHTGRPWEAPDHVLEDAGVELGVNYPYPLISAKESEAALARAAEIIQQSVVSHSSELVRNWPSSSWLCTSWNCWLQYPVLSPFVLLLKQHTLYPLDYRGLTC